MTKKILAAVVAVMMVAALTVSAFANVDLTSNATGTLNENLSFDIPADIDVSDGATVTLHLKGTSDNTTVRAYLTDANDVGRVTDVGYFEVVNGAFDATVDLLIDYEGGFGGTTAPTRIMIKGQDSSTPLANTTFEVIEVVTADAAAEEPAAEEPAAEEPAAEEPAAEEPAAEEPAAPAEEPAPAPAETPAAPATGLALAVVPAVIALAAAAVSKKH